MVESHHLCQHAFCMQPRLPAHPLFQAQPDAWLFHSARVAVCEEAYVVGLERWCDFRMGRKYLFHSVRRGMRQHAVEMVNCFSFNLLRYREVGMRFGRPLCTRNGASHEMKQTIFFSLCNFMRVGRNIEWFHEICSFVREDGEHIVGVG